MFNYFLLFSRLNVKTLHWKKTTLKKKFIKRCLPSTYPVLVQFSEFLLDESSFNANSSSDICIVPSSMFLPSFSQVPSIIPAPYMLRIWVLPYIWVLRVSCSFLEPRTNTSSAHGTVSVPSLIPVPLMVPSQFHIWILFPSQFQV